MWKFGSDIGLIYNKHEKLIKFPSLYHKIKYSYFKEMNERSKKKKKRDERKFKLTICHIQDVVLLHSTNPLN